MSVVVLPLKGYYDKLCPILLNYGVILGQVVSIFAFFSSHSVELWCHSRASSVPFCGFSFPFC